ncbi:MAG: glycosyltransferase family 4 protein [Elainellaceae cyanobacterium]
MRIAQIAPLWERVPPLAYGGIELIVSLLTDELVSRGHNVTLFASGDSETAATLQSVHSKALRLDPEVKEPGIYESMHLNSLYKNAQDFDIIHSHVGCAALPFSDLVDTPTVHTLHGIFTPDNEKLFRYASKQPYVSITDAQRRPNGLNYVATVYNGIDINAFRFYPQPDNPPYLAFLARLSPEKGVHLAIEIAKRSGIPLKMAGKVDVVDRDYFEQDIKPQIDGDQIQYLGEISHRQKNELVGRAIATLCPITWPEPFGLVITESMASGTPVIGIGLGSVPEVISHGTTGFVCDSVEDCIAAVPAVSTLSRLACRDHVATRFSVKQMVDGYEAVYQQILSAKAGAVNGYVNSYVPSDTPVSLPA